VPIETRSPTPDANNQVQPVPVEPTVDQAKKSKPTPPAKTTPKILRFLIGKQSTPKEKQGTSSKLTTEEQVGY